MSAPWGREVGVDLREVDWRDDYDCSERDPGDGENCGYSMVATGVFGPQIWLQDQRPNSKLEQLEEKLMLAKEALAKWEADAAAHLHATRETRSLRWHQRQVERLRDRIRLVRLGYL